MIAKLNMPNSPKAFIAYCDIENEVQIEWHYGKHSLHIEILEDEVQYVKIWGPNIEHEMEGGIFKPSMMNELWNWLMKGKNNG